MNSLDMEQIKKDMERQGQVADEIQKANPAIPNITAIVMAGDLVSAERWWERMVNGECTPSQAKNLVGSYARLDFAIKAWHAGYLTLDEVLVDLPGLWSGSDPDDTDPRFLSLWRAAWMKNHERYVRDGEPLPRSHNITVYRGQMPNDPVGIAWSLDRDVAERFARGAGMRVSNMPGVVYVATIDRRKVLGYLTGRKESEVVLDPAHLKNITIEEVTRGES